MRLNEDFSFGKYEGFTLQEVYQGKDYIDNDLLEAFLKYKMVTDSEIIYSNQSFFQINSLEINNGFLKATPFDEDLKENWSQEIENVFREYGGKNDFLLGNSTLKQFYNKTHAEKRQKYLVGGDPEYIEWCINNIKGFWISKDNMNYLANFKCYQFIGIKTIFLQDNIYQYFPNFSLQKFLFAKSTLEKNEINIQLNPFQYYEEDDYLDGGRSNYSRDYFDAMTDGQLGDYDDFNGSSDDITDWSGR